MSTKKILAMLLALTMILGLLAGCGSGEASTAEAPVSEVVSEPAEEAPVVEEASVEEDAPEASLMEEAPVEEPVADPFAVMAEEYISYPLEGDNSISIWYYTPGYVEYVDSNYNFNMIDDAEAATGVKLEFTEVGSTTASEQFNLMIASGDMTDLIPAGEYYVNGLTTAYEEDIIIDINDYVDEFMPNYAGVFATLPEKTQQEALTEGMMLAFRIIADGSYTGNGFVTRADWAEALGYNWDTNMISLDEFTQYMRDVHSNYNTEYTYYFTTGTISLNAAFDTYIPNVISDGFMTFVTSSIYREGDVIKSGWTDDGYREYIEWVRTMMDEGIFYEDFLSLDNSRRVEAEFCGNGKIGVWMANADKIEESAAYSTDPNYAVRAVPNITADVSQPYVWQQEQSLVTTNVGFSISSDCENPALVCQWMNYFWTTDGYNMANYGLEGESYHMDGEQAIFDWDKPVTVTGMTAPNAEMAQQLFTMMRFVSFYSDHDRLLPAFPESAIAAIETWTSEGTDERYYPSILEGNFTAEENADIAEVEADLLTYTQETCLKFITGELEVTDDSWNDYLDKCDQMGINELIAVYQNAYDQYLAGER